MSIPFIAVLIATTIAAYTDLRHGKIYNWLTFPMMLLGIIYNFKDLGFYGISFSLCGLFVGIAVYIVFAILGMVGMGDVKLMGAIGAWLGCKYAIWIFLLSSALGLPHAIIILILNWGKDWYKIAYANIASGYFLQKNIQIENKDKNTYKFYLGIDILLAVIISYFIPPSFK